MSAQRELVLAFEDARGKIEAWRKDYNNYHPHSSFGNMTLGDIAKSMDRTSEEQVA